MKVAKLTLLALALCFSACAQSTNQLPFDMQQARAEEIQAAAQAQSTAQTHGLGVRMDSNKEKEIIERAQKRVGQFRQMRLPAEEPKQFDVYDEGYITSVKNQEGCGSCVSFAVGAMVEGTLHKWLRRRTNQTKEFDVSEASFFSQSMEALDSFTSCYYGAITTAAMDAMEVIGLQPEAAMPYEGFLNDFYRGRYWNGANYHKGRQSSIFLPYTFERQALSSFASIRAWMREKGPVYTTFAVKADFGSKLFANNGIYDNPNFESVGNSGWHAVACTGYDDTYVSASGVTGAWICKNSWGSFWGPWTERPGYFRIAYGQLYLMGEAYGVKISQEKCVRSMNMKYGVDVCDAPRLATERLLDAKPQLSSPPFLNGYRALGWLLPFQQDSAVAILRDFFKMAVNTPSVGLSASINCTNDVFPNLDLVTMATSVFQTRSPINERLHDVYRRFGCTVKTV